ncbi:MAG: hypothetical protein M3178_17215 [Pseudomonadota bacterium]|nr:hypothetical protein [Pseudomonadota bacterium]
MSEAVIDLLKKRDGVAIGRAGLIVAAEYALQLPEPPKHIGLSKAVIDLLIKRDGLAIGRAGLIVAACKRQPFSFGKFCCRLISKRCLFWAFDQRRGHARRRQTGTRRRGHIRRRDEGRLRILRKDDH